eukprot:g5519.t1
MTVSIFNPVSLIDKRSLKTHFLTDTSRVVFKGRRNNGRLSWNRSGKWNIQPNHCGSSESVFFVLDAGQKLYSSMFAELADASFLWNQLDDAVSYLSRDERRLVFVGLSFAHHAHEGQFRKSGEPFIIHPVEVARILAELRADADTIVAGLLHDTVEDTDRLTFEEIGERFGESVQMIVEGETRLTKINGGSKSSANLRDLDFQRFFDSISRDVRVLLVKLADRLHNMRTMDSMHLTQQIKKAKETLEIYGPLAGLLGLEPLQEELEELSLKYLYPERYLELKEHLRFMEVGQQDFLEQVKQRLSQSLEEDENLLQLISEFNIKIRQKSFRTLFETYKRANWKLYNNQELHQVAQILIQIEGGSSSAKICYYVFGIVRNIWTPIPGRFEDFVTSIKSAAWTGVKTTVAPSGETGLVTPVEIIIQTPKLQSLSESSTEPKSSASAVPPAPFKSNQVAKNRVVSDNGKSEEQDFMEDQEEMEFGGIYQSQLRLEALQNWQREVGECISPRDYVDCVRNDFLKPTVLVFTPRGECVQLPKGATVLDFAYWLHTQVGNRAAGATVDGCSVGSNYQLKTAQVVEIILEDKVDESVKGLRRLQNRLSTLQTASAKKKLKVFIKKLFKALKEEYPDLKFEVTQPNVAETESKLWLKLATVDRAGILIDIAEAVTEEGLSISSYWGRKSDIGFTMKYLIHDPGGTSAPSLVTRIQKIDGVNDVLVGCSLTINSTDSQEW